MDLHLLKEKGELEYVKAQQEKKGTPLRKRTGTHFIRRGKDLRNYEGKWLTKRTALARNQKK